MKSKLYIQNKEEYKETELGLLPSDWVVKKFSSCIDKVKASRKIKFYQPEYQKYGKYAIVHQGKDLIAGYHNDENKLYSGDIPIIIFGDVSRTFKFIDFPFSLGADGSKIISPKRKLLDARFFFYYLKTLYIPSKGYNRHYKDLKEKWIIIPPLQEQKNIATVLLTFQEAKEKTENLTNSLKELKKSMMEHLFTYGIISFEDTDKVKLKETEMGVMPEIWDIKEIKNLVERTKQREMRKANIGFKYIDVSSIDKSNLKIISHSIQKGEKAPSRARKIVNKDDIIIATVRPTLKRIAKISEEYDNEICSTAFCVLRAKKELLEPDYLFYTVQRSTFIDKLSAIQRGGSYPAITDKDIKNQLIPFPPLSVQQKLSEILSIIDFKIQIEESKKKALDEIFNSLLHNLIMAKIRVKNIELKNG